MILLAELVSAPAATRNAPEQFWAKLRAQRRNALVSGTQFSNNAIVLPLLNKKRTINRAQAEAKSELRQTGSKIRRQEMIMIQYLLEHRWLHDADLALKVQICYVLASCVFFGTAGFLIQGMRFFSVTARRSILFGFVGIHLAGLLALAHAMHVPLFMAAPDFTFLALMTAGTYFISGHYAWIQRIFDRYEALGLLHSPEYRTPMEHEVRLAERAQQLTRRPRG